MSEAAILEVVRRNFGDHLILGEEGGIIGDTLSDYLWCIDPLGLSLLTLCLLFLLCFLLFCFEDFFFSFFLFAGRGNYSYIEF
jgi:hypothetical protein